MFNPLSRRAGNSLKCTKGLSMMSGLLGNPGGAGIRINPLVSQWFGRSVDKNTLPNFPPSCGAFDARDLRERAALYYRGRAIALEPLPLPLLEGDLAIRMIQTRDDMLLQLEDSCATTPHHQSHWKA